MKRNFNRRLGEKCDRRRIDPDGKATERTRKEVLAMRAVELSKPPRDEHAFRERTEVVEFLIAHERYGIESAYVREVFQVREYTPVPCTPSFVPGVINVRGRIIPVLDFRKFFELPNRESMDIFRVLILHSDAMEFGVLADDILGVTRICFADLQATLPTLNGVRVEYLKGVTADRLIILDAVKMLSDPSLVVHEEVS